MKLTKYLSWLLLIGSACAQLIGPGYNPGASSGAPTIVQPTSGNPLNAACAQFVSATNTCAFPVNVTSGNTGFLLVIAGTTGTIALPTKSSGTATIGTVTPIGSGCNVSGGSCGGAQQWYTFSITGSGSLTMSETFPSATNVGVYPFEVSSSGGADTGTNPVYSYQFCSGSCTGPSITTATANDLILLGEMGGSTNTYSALSPYTLSGSGPGTAGNDTSWLTGNYTDSSAGTVTSSWTQTSAGSNNQSGALAIK